MMVDHGPLTGLVVIELAGIGPGPYAAMLLADMGAEVIRVERPGPPASGVDPLVDVLRRNRKSVVVDLGKPAGVDVLKRLVTRADVFLESFRPGVTERLGLGPDDLWAVNPRLVYGRMTGWGQEGPLAYSAGHDIGYIAVTGALGAIGRVGEAPVAPINFVGDFGGGSLFLTMGVLAAVWETARSGRGQVVDAAIVDGAASLTGILHGLMASGRWRDERGVNFLDGGVPWYDTYETADGRWMAVGALEPKFYATFVDLLGLPKEAGDRDDAARRPQLRAAIATAFAGRTQAEWSKIFDGTDACVAPVLSLREAPRHPHLVARESFIDVGGVPQPAPAPRFSRTRSASPNAPVAPGAHTREVLESLGLDVDELVAAEAVVTDSAAGSRPAAPAGGTRLPTRLVEVEPGTRLVVQDLGDGPAVVLVPGFGLDHTLWDRTALLLASAGYRVVCVDQRGHGGSDKPFTGYEVTRLAADLGAVIDTLALDDATVVGHSFGGQVAFGLAAARRDLVGKLVLVGSSGVRASRSIGFPFGAPVEAVLPALLSGEEQDRISSRRETLVSAFAQKPTEEVTAWLLEISLRMPSRAALACYHSMLETDLLDLIPAVTQPVLQVIGAHDPVHSARGARWLNAQLASATLVELPDCGHYPMLEAPTEFERAVLEFLPTR